MLLYPICCTLSTTPAPKPPTSQNSISNLSLGPSSAAMNLSATSIVFKFFHFNGFAYAIYPFRRNNAVLSSPYRAISPPPIKGSSLGTSSSFSFLSNALSNNSVLNKSFSAACAKSHINSCANSTSLISFLNSSIFSLVNIPVLSTGNISHNHFGLFFACRYIS